MPNDLTQRPPDYTQQAANNYYGAYGTTTPQQAVANRGVGWSAGPSKSASSSPQQAGTIESASPGFFSGSSGDDPNNSSSGYDYGGGWQQYLAPQSRSDFRVGEYDHEGNLKDARVRAHQMELKGQQDAINRQQGLMSEGLGLLQQNVDSVTNDPFNEMIRALAEQIATQPSVDYQGIRNRAIADSNQSLNNAQAVLGSTVGRRGLGLGTGTGMAADFQRMGMLDLSRRLGELSTEEDLQARLDQVQGMGALGQAQGMTTDRISAANAALANMLGGQAQGSITNPMAGQSSWESNMFMQELLRKQIEGADDGGGWDGALQGGVEGLMTGAMTGNPYAAAGMGAYGAYRGYNQ